MNFKKWPYWLRGAVIMGGITLISYLLYYSCAITDTNGAPESWKCLPFIVFSPMLPFGMLFDTNPFLNSLPKDQILFLWPIVSIVGWFIIGALIGLIVDYVKYKKTRSSENKRVVNQRTN